jgi:hypothetical protein
MTGFALVFVSVGQFVDDGQICENFLKPGNKWDVTENAPRLVTLIILRFVA